MIVVDMDGVLVDSHTEVLRKVNFGMGTAYTLEDITAYDFRECLGEKVGNKCLEAFSTHNLYDNLEPMPGALDALEALRGLDRVVVASVPTQGHLDSKYNWCLRHGFDRKDILIGGDKLLLCRDRFRSVIIEDKLETALAWHFSHANHTSIIMDRPWNQPGPFPTTTAHVMRRVTRWVDVPDLVIPLYG